MQKQIVGTKNDFMYQAALYSIRDAEVSAKARGEKIYLIVMSTWMYEVISEHVKNLFSENVFDNYGGNKTRPIMGYQVALVEDLGYNELIKFITGKG